MWYLHLSEAAGLEGTAAPGKARRSPRNFSMCIAQRLCRPDSFGHIFSLPTSSEVLAQMKYHSLARHLIHPVGDTVKVGEFLENVDTGVLR